MNNEEQKIGRNNSPYRENVSAPDLTMNNESKCCEKCACKEPRTHAPYWNTCHNPSCPCHTPAPEQTAVDNSSGARTISVPSNIPTPAPENWEEEFDKFAGELYEPYDDGFILDPQKVKNFIHTLLTSEKAAARREGAERAMEYIKKNCEVTEIDRIGDLQWIVWRDDLDAARSEGVNG